MQNRIFALVDINNCYVSCERAFNPKLNNVPVLVLSNNDGCAIARSQEVKDLGIKMGTPLFKMQDMIKQHQIQVLSSNYALYGEMSRRFHSVLFDFVGLGEQEIYSIDECFLDLTRHRNFDLDQMAQKIKARLWQWLSLPVCIGIGATKTEAKIANHIAKKNQQYDGICNLYEMSLTSKEDIFSQIDVSEVWGVGRKHSKKLQSIGITNVLDLASANDSFIRKQFSVVMQRTVLELQGTSCIEIEHTPDAKQQIISSRSFGQRVTELVDLQSAIRAYVQDAFKRLRDDALLCGCMMVFVQSNPFDESMPFYNKSVSFSFPEPTDDLLLMSSYASKMIATLYQKGIRFKKCGVVLTCLEPKAKHTYDLLTDMQQVQEIERLMATFENVHDKFGKAKLSLGAVHNKNNNWQMSREKLSANPFRVGSFLKVR